MLWYVIVFGGEAFGRCLDHDSGALMIGISLLIKAVPLLLLPCKDSVRMHHHRVLQSYLICQHLDLASPASRTVRGKCVLSELPSPWDCSSSLNG